MTKESCELYIGEQNKKVLVSFFFYCGRKQTLTSPAEEPEIELISIKPYDNQNQVVDFNILDYLIETVLIDIEDQLFKSRAENKLSMLEARSDALMEERRCQN